MTNFFEDKLCQGGYGIAYKEKLQDGHLVAVQASKGDGEEFINEIARISRTSHDNIVSLLGCCNLPAQVEHDVQNDFQVPDDTDVPLQDESHDQLPVLEIPPDVPPRRSTRDRHPSTRYSVNEYVLLNDGGEPECYAKAMEDEHKSKWVDAMQDEMKSLHDNHTFDLVKLPKADRNNIPAVPVAVIKIVALVLLICNKLATALLKPETLLDDI
uniref:Protein kinase domain-containing protein n=1 Tax=Salix viminalis TaxID=40686 RepID=A0A6N2LA15_SALVM